MRSERVSERVCLFRVSCILVPCLIAALVRIGSDRDDARSVVADARRLQKGNVLSRCGLRHHRHVQGALHCHAAIDLNVAAFVPDRVNVDLDCLAWQHDDVTDDLNRDRYGHSGDRGEWRCGGGGLRKSRWLRWHDGREAREWVRSCVAGLTDPTAA